MIKRLLVILSVIFVSFSKTSAQCPAFFDGAGTPTNNPSFIYCQGGAYSMGIMSQTLWGAYTINWGDGSPNTTGGSNPPMTPVNHVYAATVNTFAITLTIPSAACVQTMLVVQEQAVAAGAQNFGGVTTFCAPGTVTVTNISTNVSPTTKFTWDWGDGTVQNFDYTNQNQNVSHTFPAGNVPTCQRQITLRASNACRPIPNPLNLFVDIYDLDDPVAITPDRAIKCSPENTFTLTNTTQRQCFAQGNTFQRQEKWNLGNYWGMGHDSIIDWKPWPPSTPLVITYPLNINQQFNIILLDSNRCGIKTGVTSVAITNPPTAGIVTPTGNICQNTSVTFTNASAPMYSYLWNFGTGAGFQAVGSGNPSRTYTAPGTYTVKVVAFVPGSNAACSDTATKVITVYASPVANFSFTPATGCSSITNVAFTDLSTGGISNWSWRFGNGNTSTFQTAPLQDYLTTGVFTPSLVVTGTTGCVNTKTATIVVRSTPVPNFPTIAPCVGAAGNFTNTSTITGTTAISNYTWSFGDATANSNATSPTHTYTSPGTFSVTLTAATPFCNATITKTISVNVKPTANFVVTPTVNCPPFAPTFSNTSANATSYLWQFGTAPTATSNAVTPTFTYNNTTQNFLNYTVTLTASTGLGCSDVFQVPVRVRPKPVADFVVSTSGGCSPLATTFTNNSVGATTYTWDFGDGNGSMSATPSYSFNNGSLLLLTNTITLVSTSSLNCTDTAQRTIQIFPQPLTTFTMSPGSGCTPLNVTFPSVPGVVSYTWNFGDGSPILIANSPASHVFTNTNTAIQIYTVTLTASNAFGCAASSSKTPTIYPIPSPNFLVGPTAGCSPLNGTLTNISTGATTYKWKFGDGVVSTSTNINVPHTYSNTTNTNDQTYITTLIAYTGFGCEDSVKKNVTVFYKPETSFLFSNPLCASQSITYTNNTIGLAASSWTFGDGSPASTSVSPVHTFSNNTINNITYTTTLIVTSPNGCKDTATGSPVIYAHPIANYTVTPHEGCSPLATTMTNGSSLAHNYLWRFGDGTSTVTTTNTSHTYSNTSFTANQTFSCTLTAFNNNGCKDSVKKVITVFYKPNAAFTQNDPQCASQTINFSNTSQGAAVNSWSFGDGTPLSNSLSPTHSYTNTTLNNVSYTVQLVVSTPSLCTDTAYGYPVIFAHPVAAFVMTPTIGCSPLTTMMNNNSSAAHSYKWKYSDGTPSSTLQSTTHVYVNTTHSVNENYSTTLVAYNNNGCRDSVSVPVFVFYKPLSSFRPDTPACTPKVITFTNTSIGGVSYQWDLGDGTPASTSDVSQTVSHQYINTTPLNQTFTVSMITTSPNSCKDTLKVPMIVHPKPHFFISAMPDSGCSPLTVTFPAIVGVTSYQWSYDNGIGFGSTGDIISTFTNEKSFTRNITVQLVAKDVYGCPDTSKTALSVFPKPIAKFTAYPLEVYIPNQATNMTNLSAGASTFTWSFGDGSDESSDFQPSHTYTVAGEYPIILIASNERGCRDTFDLGQKIQARDETTVRLPNAFTPNPNGSPGTLHAGTEADRFNWLFHPNVVGTQKYQFSVYSRWGELLFDTKNPDEGWDGYYKGQICTQDVYIWKVVATFVDGKSYNKTGDLLLLR